MTTVRLRTGRLVHLIDGDDPTSTVCGRPVAAVVVADPPVTCKRCKRSPTTDCAVGSAASNHKRSAGGR